MRLRVRAWRHLSDLASTLEPARPARIHPPLRNLQHRLGRLHDLDVVADLSHPIRDSAWAEALRRERRQLRRRLVAQLRRNRSAEIVPGADPSA